MPPTRGHLKLALYFLALALIGAWCATSWISSAREAAGDGELVRFEDARRIAVTLVVGCAVVGFLGVLVRRMAVARARAREQAMWVEKVQAESQKYRALFEGSADMLLIVDPRTRSIREGNAPAREQLGAPAGIEELLLEAQRAPFREVLQRAAAPGGAPELLADLQVVAVGKRTLVCDARCAPIALAGEALVLVSLHDRTRQRAMERELAMRERLASIGLFTAGVAHEINNPLEGMGNYLTLLEQPDLPAENRGRYLGLVQHGFGRIRDLVRDLLRFARPENSSARIDLAQVVSNASKLVALSSALKEVRIETRGLERPLLLLGDAGRLEQVLVNLLLNAGKAQDGRGRIVLAARALPAENALELSVEDDGPGIPAESLTRIFDPFFGSGEGTGLGLPVSYGIVRAHGGTIAAENRPEGGARFLVRLPRNLPESSDEASHVLIVDDEEFVRDSLEEILRSKGFETSAAAGAQEAMRFLEKRDCDAIVTDLRMPRGDGLSLLNEARRRGVGIPIVMITGVGTVAEAVQAMKAGAFDFLQKPVQPEELVRVVARAVEHHALQQELQQLRGAVASLRRAEELVGSSPAMRALREQLVRLAETDSTVLITGETGTGKQLCAREIHDRSARSRRLLVRVDCENCAAEDLAARIAEAQGGTLLCDDVGALRPETQGALARLLERGEYEEPSGAVRSADVRVLATSAEDLAARVRAGRLKAELYHRLDVVPLRLPPLREHLADIPEIAAHHLQHAKVGGQIRTLAPEAHEVLASHEWPGNVRELRNVLERALIVVGEGALSADVLRSILEPVLAQPPARAPDGSLVRLVEFNLRRNVDLRERETVLGALRRSSGVKKEACELLGIDPRNLGYYLRKHKLKEEEWAKG